MQADLIIVGAGMVGSALALALEHSGLEILVVDGGPLSVRPFAAEGAFEPRVSALSAASQRILVTLEGRGGLVLKPLEFPVVLRCVSTRPFVQVSSDLRRQNLQRAIQARVFPPSRQTLRHRFYLSGASTESFCQNLVGVILDHPPSTSFNR